MTLPRSRRINVNLDMQGLSTLMNLPDAHEEGDAAPLRQIKAMVDEVKPDSTDYLAAYLLAKS